MRFLKDFGDFVSGPLPEASYAEYRTYMRRSMQFIESRNMRIAEVESGQVGRVALERVLLT